MLFPYFFQPAADEKYCLNHMIVYFKKIIQFYKIMYILLVKANVTDQAETTVHIFQLSQTMKGIIPYRRERTFHYFLLAQLFQKS